MIKSFLVSLAMAVLKEFLIKGSTAWFKYEELKKELEKNKEKADKYQSVVDNNDATREDRRKAEDELLS